MRKLMWLTLGFGAACALSAYLLPGKWVFWCALGAAVLAGIVRWPFRGRRAAVLLLGACLGFAWFGAFRAVFLADAVEMDGEITSAEVRISDYSYQTDYGSAADGTVKLGGRTYQARIYFRENLDLEPGETMTGDFRFRVTTPEGSEDATYHKGRGIFLILYQKGELRRDREDRLTWRDRVAVLGRAIRENLENSFPEDTEPFAKALLLGDTRDLDYETNTAFKVSGIRHVVAVSGLHVSILFALLSAVTFRKRGLTALVGFPVLLLFAALAGFTPSITRSVLMWCLILLGKLVDREYDGATALSFAALVMLVVNPLVITDVGFQLSVGSVAGIFLFSGPIRKGMVSWMGEGKKGSLRRKVTRWFTGSVSVTLGAMVFTTPLAAWYFGAVSLVGVVTNLLVLWVIGAIFYGLLAVAALGFCWEAGAAALAKVLAWPIRYVLVVSKFVAKFPLAAVYTVSPYIVAWLVFVYVLLLVFGCRKDRRVGTLLCCGVLGLCLALTASWGEPMLDDFRFTVLDVGQGQCLLVQNEGRIFMVDCGGSYDSDTADLAAEKLLSWGIPRIDGLVLTHYDRDHAGGAAGLLSRVGADVVIAPAEPNEFPVPAGTRVLYADRELSPAR